MSVREVNGTAPEALYISCRARTTRNAPELLLCQVRLVSWVVWMVRARCRLRQRRASPRLFPSACLRASRRALEATHRLITVDKAQASWIGIGLATISTPLMPLFGYAKKRIGVQLESAATTGEGTQNILCAYLSLAILVGLAANAVLGIWWADPAVALIVAVVAVQTGISTWRGQGCASSC